MLNSIKNQKSNIQNPKLKHPMISWKRTLRTGCEILNEQFCILNESTIQHPPSNIHHPTFTIQHSPSNIQHPSLTSLLPDVDLDHGNLNYTVVIGEVLGNFEAQKK
jgi:hypothetical protein